MKRISVTGCARWVETGHPLTEEMFKDALELLAPPLLPAGPMAALLLELDPDAPRKRGRPIGNALPRRVLADQIRRLERPDIPATFISALLERLCSGKRLTEKAYLACLNRVHRARRRDQLIRIFYREFYSSPVLDGELTHPVMGSFTLPPQHPSWTKRRLALELTHTTVRDFFGFVPPSLGTLRNIVSGRKYSPRS